MGSLEKRLETLEARIVAPDENKEANKEAKEIWRALYAAALDEFGRLKAARARGCYRGGNPPTPIQPRDLAGERLGYPYTTGQITDLAIELAWEREGFPEELMADWKESFKALTVSAGINLEKVEAYGPPEPTPPWCQRGGRWYGA
jgi:hypothetical protein